MGSISDSQEVDIEIKEEKKFEDRIPGCLSVLHLSDKEMECFLDYLAISSPQSYTDYIYTLLGDKRFLSYLDVLEGLTIKIPSRQSIVKTVNYIKIYMYLKSRNFTEEAYNQASKLYKKRVVSLKRIVNKVEETLDRKQEDLEYYD